MPAATARCLTGEPASSIPLPLGRSGAVATARTRWWESSRASSVGTAASGVPRKTVLSDIVQPRGAGEVRSRSRVYARLAPNIGGRPLKTALQGRDRLGRDAAQRLLPQPPPGLTFQVRVDAVDEQHAVEVVDLVLEDPSQPVVHLDLDPVAAFVHADDLHPLRP